MTSRFPSWLLPQAVGASARTLSHRLSLLFYRYAILSRIESSETTLRTTVFFDGQRRYEFYAAIPPLAEEEYEAILASFVPAPTP